MKKFLYFFYFFYSIIFFGQKSTERFVYQAIINVDTINLVPPHEEKVFLDISSNQSVFISEYTLKKDSVLQQKNLESPQKENLKKKNADLPLGSFRPSLIRYVVVKNLSLNTIDFYEKLGTKTVFYSEDRKITWTITPEKDNGLQKATTHFAGRTWQAWFDPNIKIPDGPYKFSGLPGLIVKLEDDKGDYRFNLLTKKTLQNAYTFTPYSPKKVNRIDFNGEIAAAQLEMSNFNNSNHENQNTPSMRGMGSKRQGGGMGGMNGGMSGRNHGERYYNSMRNGNPQEPLNNISSYKRMTSDKNPIEINSF